MKPLAERLRAVLAQIPAEVQHDGISLAWIASRLRGRQGRGCQAGELGTAFRELGWEPRRNWRKSAAGYRSLWFRRGEA